MKMYLMKLTVLWSILNNLYTNLYKTFLLSDFMEKDIDRIEKNPDTDIVIRIDDFGGRVGLTIREFVKSDRYTGFTKAGTRIPADKFEQFKAAINSIDEAELEQLTAESEENRADQTTLNSKENKKGRAKKVIEEAGDNENNSEEMEI